MSNPKNIGQPGTGKVMMPPEKTDPRNIVIDDPMPEQIHVSEEDRRRLNIQEMKRQADYIEAVNSLSGGSAFAETLKALQGYKESATEPKTDKLPDAVKHKEDQIDEYLTFFVNHQ